MRLAAPLSAALLLAAARPAVAGEAAPDAAADAAHDAAPPGPPDAPAPADEHGFLGRFVLDDGRIAYTPPDPTSLRFNLHGEYQLRFQGQSTLALEPPLLQPQVNTLGQSYFLYHWLRIGARFDLFDKVAVVVQIDAPRGMIAGQTTQEVEAARDSFSQAQWDGIYPRYLYVEVNSPIGLFRLGQQGAHWGMGLVANDGDHTTLFGDHRRGALVERFLYAVTPLGKGTPLFLAAGADLVFQDETADLLGGDRAVQGFGAVGLRGRSAEIGVYGVGRHQWRSADGIGAYTSVIQTLNVGVVDLYGRFDAPLPAGGFVYGEMEAAGIFGATTFLQGAYLNGTDPAMPTPAESVRSYGGAATVGAVKVAGTGKDRFGQVMGEIELGYASGDADPSDGVSKRFTFDENHHVGLVLFDQVLRWKTARSATIAQDPNLVARAAPGLELLPSNGGVFGAQYVNPRFVVRPRRWLDLKGGVVIAQTTADFVDPYQWGALGNARNYDGGASRAHDLGVELDAGLATRIEVDPAATVQLGAEGGVLFPGHAFDDAAGHRLQNQYLGSLQAGLQF